MSQSNVATPLTGDWPADDERVLVERACVDRAAFALLYRRHYPGLVAHIRRRTGDLHLAEDLAADVFLAALKALHNFRYCGISVRCWLLRIATNAVNRWARRRRRTTPLEHAPESADPASPRDALAVEQAQRALLAIAPHYQAVLTLHYLEGLPVLEIAAILGRRVGTVKSRLARAREALRAELCQRRES